jgi:hypothetical protein
MIILHSQHDEKSRRFVEKYGEGNEVLSYPECVQRFPYIRAFPSVIIDVPAYHVPAGTISEEQEAFNVAAHEELVDTPVEWSEVEEAIEAVNQRAADYPPIES